ncbi:hypothetical protein C5F52_03280 [Limnohabitans sp. TS-CS-82]|jgi:uncharacterized protein (TIGR02001 family)|uniref:TorF family putative porin n=1 Tax=Limnohabitans sp. TS-CS-82 TaxID=2094193 RepID=UPI000CF1DFF9|nr:TorF family putative porin [Limnohabitans sp. TS-CS-82]PQA85029.1 hypothetical protein C5F52_03280 [Limnohabitans sp. TS-CS-82]
MNLKSKIVLALLATSSAAFAQTAPVAPEVTYNVGVVSQYRYRGIAQTKGDAALQGGVDYANANGFYLGAWGSTIKWIKDAGSDAKGPVELDLYGGYKFEAAGVAYDVGYLRYEYVNNTYNKVSGAVNANTDEVYGAATYGVVTAKYSYAFSDLFGTANSKGSAYWDLSANFDLGNGYTLTPHAGRQVIKNSPNSYTDIALTLGKDLGDGLSASVSAISTSVKDNAYYTSTATSYNTAKNALVVGVKYSF